MAWIHDYISLEGALHIVVLSARAKPDSHSKYDSLPQCRYVLRSLLEDLAHLMNGYSDAAGMTVLYDQMCRNGVKRCHTT